MTRESAPSPVTRPSIAALAVASGLVAPFLRGGPAASPSALGAVVAGGPAGSPGQPRVLTLPAGFRPHGLTSCGGTLYLSSPVDGRVLAVQTRTGRARTLLAGTAGRVLHGLAADARTGLLYAAGREGPDGVVLAVERRSGRLSRRWTLPGAGSPADLVITPTAVWVTDSLVDRLTRLFLGRDGRPDRQAPAVLPLTAPWPTGWPTGPSSGRGGGIRGLPGGDLLLAHGGAGGLWTVDPETGRVRPVPVTGGPSITGGGGLERDGARVWVLRGASRNGIAQLRLDHHHGGLAARWTRELTGRSLDGPLAVTGSAGRLWAVNVGPDTAAPTASSWLTGLPLHRSPAS